MQLHTPFLSKCLAIEGGEDVFVFVARLVVGADVGAVNVADIADFIAI